MIRVWVVTLRHDRCVPATLPATQLCLEVATRLRLLLSFIVSFALHPRALTRYEKKVEEVVASWRRSRTARERPWLKKSKNSPPYDDDQRRPCTWTVEVMSAGGGSGSDDAAAMLRFAEEHAADDDEDAPPDRSLRKYNPPATGDKESYTLLKARSERHALPLLAPVAGWRSPFSTSLMWLVPTLIPTRVGVLFPPQFYNLGADLAGACLRHFSESDVDFPFRTSPQEQAIITMQQSLKHPTGAQHTPPVITRCRCRRLGFASAQCSLGESDASPSKMSPPHAERAIFPSLVAAMLLVGRSGTGKTTWCARGRALGAHDACCARPLVFRGLSARRPRPPSI